MTWDSVDLKRAGWAESKCCCIFSVHKLKFLGFRCYDTQLQSILKSFGVLISPICFICSIDLRNVYVVTSRLSTSCIDDALISTFDNVSKEMKYVTPLLFTLAVAESWPSPRVEREAEMDGKMDGNERLVVTW